MTAPPPPPNVVISSSQRAVRVPRADIRRLVAFLAQAEGAAIAEVDLAVVPADEMAAMNRRYLRHAGATDVLSFDMSDDTRTGLAVQLVVCGEVAAKEAAARGLPVRHELLLYVIHGLLHVMGYEDQSLRGAAKMHAREEELLADFLRPRRGGREGGRER